MQDKKFKAIKGQVDYSNIRYAPVINCVLQYKNQILLVQRDKNLNFYPSFWNGISGFLDDNKSIKGKALQEINEEIGVPKDKVTSIKMGQVFDQEAPKYRKTWIVHPILVKVKTNKIKLDWEAKNYKWITKQEVKKLNLLPGFDLVLKTFGFI